MSHFIKIILCVSTLSLLMTLGCKKKDNNKDTVNIAGTWIGYWDNAATGNNIRHDFTAVFSANNTGRIKYFSFDVPCTWEYRNNKITFEYDEPTDAHFRHSGTISGSKMSGTWGIFPEDSGSGNFELTKR